MGIRPVDMQIVVQKAPEIHQAKQTVVSKQDNALQQMQVETQNESAIAQHTVNSTEETAQNAIDANQNRNKGSGDGLPGRKKKKKKEDESDSLPSDPFGLTGRHFDIKV